MSYAVVFGPRAEEDFHNIGDPVLQGHVLDELDPHRRPNRLTP